MRRLRVLVAEDSITVRKSIVEMLSRRPDFDVVGEAADGQLGFELCRRLRPDVMTLDMMMPVMNGLAATESIMAFCPTPILIVSSSTNRGELFRTYDALAAGALDVMEKPGSDIPDQAWEDQLVAALKLIARIKVITHPRASMALRGQESFTPRSIPPFGGLSAVAIGASTGGPGALREIFKKIPADFPLPILLVIHLSKIFGTAFDQWLDGESPLRVAFAKNGEVLPARGQGKVFMAPPDRHMTLRDGRLWLADGPERHSCRPSVDSLFESVALELGSSAAGCLLTGMGKDGAAGLLAMRQAGAFTIAQDEATSVVYGMPREAALIGAATRVLPLNQIVPVLSALLEVGVP